MYVQMLDSYLYLLLQLECIVYLLSNTRRYDKDSGIQFCLEAAEPRIWLFEQHESISTHPTSLPKPCQLPLPSTIEYLGSGPNQLTIASQIKDRTLYNYKSHLILSNVITYHPFEIHLIA